MHSFRGLRAGAGRVFVAISAKAGFRKGTLATTNSGLMLLFRGGASPKWLTLLV